MTIRRRNWVGLGLGTAFLSTGLIACSPETGEAGEASGSSHSAQVSGQGEVGEGEGGEGEGGEGEAGLETSSYTGEGEGGEGEGGESGEGESGEAGHDMATLPLPNRLAFMTGHVEAGLALYRAGEPAMASVHLLHPVSETHQAERAGLDELGFQASLFKVVSASLEEGKPAEEVEPQLAAAEENLAMVAAKAGGEPADIIRYLMDTIVEEYTIAITDGAVSDPGEYQDAFGFAIVAKDRAASWADAPDGLMTELDVLISLWPEAPIPPDAPAAVGQVIAQTSKVALTLPQ